MIHFLNEIARFIGWMWMLTIAGFLLFALIVGFVLKPREVKRSSRKTHQNPCPHCGRTDA
jgi:hypothetical protein